MKKFKFVLILFLIIIALAGAYFFQSNYRLASVKGASVDLNGKLVINFLDVGQGDAILIRLPKGEDVLIDGGPDNKVIKKLGEYLPYGDRDIELMVLTHPHSDHVTGLNEVLKRYGVKKILMTGAIHTASDYLNFLEQIKEKKIPVEIIDSPRDLFLENDVDFKILYPDKSFSGQRVENLNNTSIVAQLIYASTTVMLSGDFENEESLLNRGFNLKSDIYKVGHHGSNTANSREFLEAISPLYAIIGVGADNKFGHPHFRTLRILEKIGAKIFRADRDGDVRFMSDGKAFEMVK